jgi:predicted N-acetyltransferase YhbS
VILIRDESSNDLKAREGILDACFGASRLQKTCERLREGRLPADGLALVAQERGRVVGTVRLWPVTAGPGRPALMLGPLAVEGAARGAGVGAMLMSEALGRAGARGHRAVLLVGDEPYYGRFGFSTEPTGSLWLPGPYERERFLALELEPGALAGALGLVAPAGRPATTSDPGAIVVDNGAVRRAA